MSLIIFFSNFILFSHFINNCKKIQCVDLTIHFWYNEFFKKYQVFYKIKKSSMILSKRLLHEWFPKNIFYQVLPIRILSNKLLLLLKFILVDLAKLIATKYSYISNLKDEDGMTALQLLACDSLAFKVGREYGFLKHFMSSCTVYFPSMFFFHFVQISSSCFIIIQ